MAPNAVNAVSADTTPAWSTVARTEPTASVSSQSLLSRAMPLA